MSLLELAKTIGKVPASIELDPDILSELSSDYQYSLRYSLLLEFLEYINLSYKRIPRGSLTEVIPWIKVNRPEIWHQITLTEDAIDLTCLSSVVSLREYKCLLDDWLSLYRKGFWELVQETGHE